MINVERPFKNKIEQYNFDKITVKTWEDNIKDFNNIWEEGSVIGIKGRIQSYISKNNNSFLEIIADRVHFLV
jgi:single-stranded DNA-binding protein